MSGYIRQIQVADGEPIAPPSTVVLSANSWATFANDAAYETDKGGPGTQGDAYFNTTELLLRVHNGTEWVYLQNGINRLEDAASSGSNVDLDPTYHNLLVLSNAGMVSARSLDPAQTLVVYLSNQTGGDVLLLHDDAGATVGTRLILPDAATFTLANGNTAHFVYDASYNGGDGAFLYTNAAGNGGGAGGAGLFNYIENPRAADDATTGVTESATTGSWTVAQTTTDAELPGTDPTAFLISGASLTVNDFVAFSISQNIALSDGGIVGTLEVKTVDVNGSLSSDYEVRLWSVTDSVYVGGTIEFQQDGTYPLDAFIVADNDYEIHLIAKVASPAAASFEFGLFAGTQRPGALISEAQVVTPVNWLAGSAGTTTQDKFVWRIVGGYLEGEIYFQQTAAGTPIAQDLQMVLPNGYTIDGTRTVIYDASPSAIQDLKFPLGYAIYSSSSGGTGANGVHLIARSSTTIGFTQVAYSIDTIASISANVLGNANTTISGTFRVPITQLANAHTPLLNDVLLDSSRARFYRAAAYGYTANTTFAFDTEDTTTFDQATGITNTAGVFDFEKSGTYDFNIVCGANPGWAANTQCEIRVNRAGGGFTQERVPMRPGSVSFIMDGNSSIALDSGDQVEVRFNNGATIIPGLANTFIEIRRRSDYSGRATGLPFPNGTVLMDTGSSVGTGHGSSATKIRNFVNVLVFGDAFVGTSDNVNGGQVVLNRDMVVSVTYSDGDTLSADNQGISVNASTTTDVTSLSPYDGTSGRLISSTSQTNNVDNCSATIKLKKGDILRPHTNGTQNRTDNRVQMLVQEVGRLG